MVSEVEEERAASTSTTPIFIIILDATELTDTLHSRVATNSRVVPSSAWIFANKTLMMSSAASISWASMS
jgi:hypothetical protein